jgi:hypothetical protein
MVKFYLDQPCTRPRKAARPDGCQWLAGIFISGLDANRI